MADEGLLQHKFAMRTVEPMKNLFFALLHLMWQRMYNKTGRKTKPVRLAPAKLSCARSIRTEFEFSVVKLVDANSHN